MADEGRETPVLTNQRIITYLFVAAMVAAPFLALLYDLAVSLAVLSVALAATTYLALDAARDAEPVTRQRLLALGGANAVFCVLALGFLAARLANLL